MLTLFFLRYKLISSAKDTDKMSSGFDRHRNRRRNGLTNNLNKKANYFVRIMLRDIFDYVKNEEKDSYGLGYYLKMGGNKDDAILQKTVAFADARIKIDHILWYVPHCTPIIQQRGILSKQILIRTPTELRYLEKSVFMKEVKNQMLWNFELGSHESMNVPIWIFLGFQQRDSQDSQNVNNDTFCRLPVIMLNVLSRRKKILMLAFY